jgi:uncharacterized protein
VLWLAAGLLATAWVGGTARAQDLLAVPALSARVIDQTGTLTEAQRAALEAKLAAFEAEAGPQMVVLLVPTTAPEDIAAYVQRLGDAWKIGRPSVGDGLLLVVALNDRRMWIAPAKALEGAIPDLAARQIIQQRISPAFKLGDFAGGLNAGVDALIARIRGENLPPPGARPAGEGALGTGWSIEDLLIFFFVAVPVVSSVLTGMLGRRLGSVLTAGATGGLGWVLTQSWWVAAVAGVIALVVVGILGIGSAARRVGNAHRGGRGPVVWGGTGGFGSGGGWSSGGGGFGGGGGFSSGGGGDFGGGGAGGDW